MRACGRCGHDNADQLIYCFRCGRRLDGQGVVTLPAEEGSGSTASIRAGGERDHSAPGAPAAEALAATVAMAANANAGPPPPPIATPTPSSANGDHEGLLFWSIDSLRYALAHVRGRIDAEGQRRRLVEEREGARRLLDGVLAEVGQQVRVEPASAPPFDALIEGVERAEARREAATADLTAAQRFQAAEDLRLQQEQAAAEVEWKACVAGAADVDGALQRVDDERREIDVDIARLEARPQTGDVQHRNVERATLAEKRVSLNGRYASLRERAAALRASTVATRTRMDHAISARRQVVVAMAASLAAQARERSEAEAQFRELITQLGRAAFQARVALPALAPTYDRVDRLEQVIAERDRQIATVERTRGRHDVRRLAAGVGFLVTVLGALGATLWAFVRWRG